MEEVALSLGDEGSSDVVISVVDKDGKEMKKFYCHSAILSGILT